MKTYSLLLSMVLCVLSGSSVTRADWTMFRGGADGSNARAAIVPPTRWSDKENIAWKIPLTGTGLSSPIVVKNRVIITSVTGVKQDRLHVFCYSANDGKEIWHRQLWATGRTLTHPMSSVAANTPASDGERIFAFFSSNDLAAFDMDGNLLWFRGLALDFPLAGNDVGMSSSPIISGDTVIAQSEAQGESFIVGLDANTGATRYQIDRPKVANWTTPVLHRFDDNEPKPTRVHDDELIISGADGVFALNAQTGKQIWKIETKCDSISSVVLLEEMLFVPANGVTAYEFKKFGEAPELVWNNPKLNPGASSVVPHPSGEKVHVINRAGVLNAADGKTGVLEWQLRLKGSFWATPLSVSNTIYACGKDGTVQVIDCGQDPRDTYEKESYGKAKPNAEIKSDETKNSNESSKSDELKKTDCDTKSNSGEGKPASEQEKKSAKNQGKMIAENKLDGDIYASPAFSDDAIYIRTKTDLYKIAGKKKDK